MEPTILQNGNRSPGHPISSLSCQAQLEIFPMPCRFREEGFLTSFEMTRSALTGQRLTLLLIVIACVLWFSARPARAAEKIRVAYPAVAPGLTPSWVTAEAGIWRKYSLDVETILV